MTVSAPVEREKHIRRCSDASISVGSAATHWPESSITYIPQVNVSRLDWPFIELMVPSSLNCSL